MCDEVDALKEERAAVAISWKGVSVWTEERRPWYRRGGGPTRRNYILQNVEGEITDGSFVAVIGPSGAGKTTLLATLAGRCRLPREGAVTVAGACAVELVPQHDVFISTLTVAEHLHFMAEMRLSKRSSASYGSKWNRMNATVQQLRLQACVDTTIGALSGGEKKLLSLATSMLSDPKIILCDEPTTGLDSHSAAHVVGVLRELSAAGSTVVCSIHQPSSQVFQQFHSVVLLAEARMLFHGTQDQCREVFESLNLVCPKAYNPAEFYVKQVSYKKHNNEENYAEKLHQVFLVLREENSQKNSNKPPSITRQQHYKRYRPNWFRQVMLLVWRYSLSFKREIPMHLLQLFLYLVSAMILGVVYGGVTRGDQRAVQNARGLLWLTTSEVSFGVTYASLAAFGFDITLYKREVDVYSGSAYYVATFICMLPRCVIWPFLFLLISTSGFALPSYFVTVGKLTATLTLLALASAAYGVGMAALFTTTGVIVDIIPCVDLLLFLASGAFVRLPSMPAWSRPLKYLSHFFYGLEAVSNIYWQQVDSIDCATNSTSTCLLDGAQVLAEDGYSPDFYIQDSAGLLCLVLAWCLVGYWGLRREGNKGYAY